MLGLELYDLSVGFGAALVLVNLFPSLSKVGAGIIKGAVGSYTWAKNKISG